MLLVKGMYMEREREREMELDFSAEEKEKAKEREEIFFFFFSFLGGLRERETERKTRREIENVSFFVISRQLPLKGLYERERLRRRKDEKREKR